MNQQEYCLKTSKKTHIQQQPQHCRMTHWHRLQLFMLGLMANWAQLQQSIEEGKGSTWQGRERTNGQNQKQNTHTHYRT